jgi:hypothetical protein
MNSDRFDIDARDVVERTTSRTWALVAVAALVVLAGFMFYNSGGHGGDRPERTALSVIQTNPSEPERQPPSPNSVR